MKKNRWASIHKVLKIGLPFYALLLFSLSSISSIGVTHAASSLCLPLLCTPTPTPTPTPMPTPTPTPMPTPTPTPMPTPTPTPQVQPTPIIYVPPVEPTPTDTPTPVTPTATPVTATATTVTVNPNKTTTTKTDTTSANEQPQGTGDKGINIVMISLGVAIPVLLFTGGMIWLLWRRQANQYNPAIQGQGALLNAPASPWMNNHVMLPNADPFPYASPTALVPGSVWAAYRQPISVRTACRPSTRSIWSIWAAYRQSISIRTVYHFSTERLECPEHCRCLVAFSRCHPHNQHIHPAISVR